MPKPCCARNSANQESACGFCSSILKKKQQQEMEAAFDDVCAEMHWEKCEETLLDTHRERALMTKYTACGALLEGVTQD